MSARQKRVAAAIALASVLGCAGASPVVTYQPLDVGSAWRAPTISMRPRRAP
jgi:hypothetical protein